MAVDTGLFVAMTLVYLVLIIGLGYLGYRRTKENDDYMVAGRKIHPVVLAFFYGATFISTSAIVGFGGGAGAPRLGRGTGRRRVGEKSRAPGAPPPLKKKKE